MKAKDWIDIKKNGMPEEHEVNILGKVHRESNMVLIRVSNGQIFTDLTLNGNWVMVRKYYGTEHTLEVTHYQEIVGPEI
jgi:hypothetical protein